MIKKIGIIANLEKKKSKEASGEIAKFLKRHRVEVLGLDNINKSQLVIAIGGDGMVLRAVQLVHPKIPVLPIHSGSLGSLSQMNVTQFKEKFGQIIREDFKIENRMMLSASIGNSKCSGAIHRTFRALNDFVIERKTHRAIMLDIQIENQKLATYVADGLIIATPTGSTAYSLAAGGPVVNSLLCVLVLTPISPHTLMNRSFVLAGNESVEIFPKDDCFLTIDGQKKIPVNSGAAIIVKKSPLVFKLIQIGERKFYSSIKKLGS